MSRLLKVGLRSKVRFVRLPVNIGGALRPGLLRYRFYQLRRHTASAQAASNPSTQRVVCARPERYEPIARSSSMSCATLLDRVLAMLEARWSSTVFGLMSRVAAIILLLSPRVSKQKTTFSRGVSVLSRSATPQRRPLA